MSIQQYTDLMNEEYKDKVDHLIKSMIASLYETQPADPIEYLIDYLNNIRTNNNNEIKPTLNPLNDNDIIKSDNKSEQFNIPTSSAATTANKGSRRRAGVSAEPAGVVNFVQREKVVYPKTSIQREAIMDAVTDNILFSALDKSQMDTVVDAMFDKKYNLGDSVIKQGEDGDNFYVVGEGTLECYVSIQGKTPILVKTYSKGDSFGELALMYNCPRAATIKVVSPSALLWAMDRITFRQVLMDTTAHKRQRYESFLEKVALLSSLDKYERAKIADALIDRTFEDGEFVIRQGDRGDYFYIIESGEAKATKLINKGAQPEKVLDLKQGDFFGELALLNDAPRAANVIAVGQLKVAMLDRSSFIRLLGPCDEILSRNMKNYAYYEHASYQNKLEAVRGHNHLDVPREPTTGAAAGMRRRTAVSSETVSAMTETSTEEVVVHPKTEEQAERIRKSIQNNFLFLSLDDKQKSLVIDTMKERKFAAGDVIIKQGDTGDFFYVLDKGTCECFVQKDKTTSAILVKTYEHGESFGELALMYNCPRAATVVAKTEVIVWAMERVVFRRVLMQTTATKRSLYESFLSTVFLLESLDKYERAKIADALLEVVFKDGEYVIKEGDAGDNFYLVVDGRAFATKTIDGKVVKVFDYAPGSFFGELAMLSDVPRAANVVANGDLKCVYLDRSSFVRLLGPCEEILKRNMNTYKKMEAEALLSH